MKKNLISYVKRILKLVRLDEMEILPGHLAFYLIFILIPIIAYLNILNNDLNIDTYNFINKNVPNAVITLFDSHNNNSFNLILFIIISLILTSRGMKAIIITSNLLYKIPNKNSFKIRLKAINLAIILFLLIAFMVLVPVLGDLIIEYLATYFKIGLSKIYHILKYPISLILMYELIKIIYRNALMIKINRCYFNSGALFTTIMWFMLSRIYSFYLNNYNSYDIYYGSLSNILILFIWVYLLSYIFVFGLALNSDNYLVNLKENNK